MGRQVEVPYLPLTTVFFIGFNKEGEIMNNENNYTVYMHISPSDKVYIGVTKQNPKYRWNNGNGYLSKNKHGEYAQPYFARAILKYGWEDLTHVVLFDNLSKEEAEHRERLLISLWKSNDPRFGYNIRSGGGVNSGFPEERRILMSQSRMGENSSMFGRTHSEETRKKMSEAAMGEKNHMYGKRQSEETRKKISEALSGEKNYMYGKHHSEETKSKISKATKGKYLGENSPNFGRHPSEETKQKMRDAKLGKKTGRGRPVYCTELDRKWDTVADAEKDTGAHHILQVLSGDRKASGRHPITNEKLHWIDVGVND